MTEIEEQDIIGLFSVLSYDIVNIKGTLRNSTLVLQQLAKLRDTYNNPKLYAFQCELIAMIKGELPLPVVEFVVPAHSHSSNDVLIEQLHLEIQLIGAAVKELTKQTNTFTELQCDTLQSLVSRQRQLRDHFALLVEKVA